MDPFTLLILLGGGSIIASAGASLMGPILSGFIKYSYINQMVDKVCLTAENVTDKLVSGPQRVEGGTGARHVEPKNGDAGDAAETCIPDGEQRVRDILEREYGIVPVRATRINGRAMVLISAESRKVLVPSDLTLLAVKIGMPIEVGYVRVCDKCGEYTRIRASSCPSCGKVFTPLEQLIGPAEQREEEERRVTDADIGVQKPPVTETQSKQRMAQPEYPPPPDPDAPLNIRLTKTARDIILKHPDFGSIEKFDEAIRSAKRKVIAAGTRRFELMGEAHEEPTCALIADGIAVILAKDEDGQWVAKALIDAKKLKREEREREMPFTGQVTIHPPTPSVEEVQRQMANMVLDRQRKEAEQKMKPQEPVKTREPMDVFPEHEEGAPVHRRPLGDERFRWPTLPPETQRVVETPRTPRFLDDTCPSCNAGVVDRWSLQCSNCGAQFDCWVCEACGGQVDPEYLRCTGCGTEYRFKPPGA